MAGDWIKMEACTPEKSEVLAITVRMGWDDADKTIGVLFRVWRWFDQHTTDGNAHSVTSALLDRIIGVTGFCNAMEYVGWLVIHDDGLTLPNFEFHNGKTAKSRAQGAKRAANFKSNAKVNGKSNGDSVTSALPREEKRREDTTVKPEAGDNVVKLHSEQHQTGSADGSEGCGTEQPGFLENIGDADFARLVAENHAKAFGLARAVPIGMVLGNTICTRARSYGPANDPKWWLNYFERCADDEFLNGTKNPKFKADLSYLLREDTFSSVIEASQKEAAHG